jgi:micrococcal nuclease
MKKRRTRISFITLVFLLSLPVHTWAWTGEVVGITDGNTIIVLNSETMKNVKIRLYGIDTPEKGQAFGKKAKQFTSGMVFGKVVEVEVMDTDRYGRTVALVAVNKQILNEELLKAGYAWVYYQYCHEMICHAWADYQFAAKLDKRGLWRDPDPIPPWEFRRKKRRK